MDGWADSIALCVWVAEQCVGRGRAGRERRQDWDGVDEFFRDAPPLEIEARRVLGVLALCAACVCVGAKAQTRRVGGVLGPMGSYAASLEPMGSPRAFPRKRSHQSLAITCTKLHLLRSRTAEQQNCEWRMTADRISIPFLILILGRGPLTAAARYSASPAGSQLLRPARGRSRGSRRGTPSLKRVRQPLRISAPKASKGRSQEIRGGATRPVLRRPYVPES